MAPPRGSLVDLPPVVDLQKGMFGPLPTVQASLNPFHRVMRSTFGAIIFLLIAFFMGALPVIAIPPIFFLMERCGVVSHWFGRRCFDLCCANWMSVMTVRKWMYSGCDAGVSQTISSLSFICDETKMCDYVCASA